MLALIEPWPAGFTINARSPYGPRVHPITGKRTFHHGVDVAMPVGTPLTAAADGTIAKKGAGASGGYTLLIRHEGNFHTVYYHLQKPSHRNIGERVTAGELVAHSGNTGASTGPHLHFELRRSRNWGDTLDPVPAFRLAQRPEAVEEPTSRPAKTRPTRMRVPPMVSGVRGVIGHGARYLRGRGIW